MSKELPKLSHLLAEQTNCHYKLVSTDWMRAKAAGVMLEKFKRLHPEEDWSDVEGYVEKEQEAQETRKKIGEIQAVIDSGEYEYDINPRTPNEE